MQLSLWVPCLVFLATGATATLPPITHVHSKFEYRYSFKGPYLTNNEGRVPYWNHGGSCIPSDEQVRVCPSIKSRKGWIWSKETFSHKHWMIDVSLRITGRLKTGADGMAFWFTSAPGAEGMVFGNTEVWKGLAIILDSFDNDMQHDNPKIVAVMNDGTMRFDHSMDGGLPESGGCIRDYRNKPNPVKLRILFLRGVLEVWVHDGVSTVADDYQLCLRTEATNRIPLEGYFGITSATGGLSDDHDVLKFVVHRLTPLEEMAEEQARKSTQINQEESEQLTNKYSDLSSEFDQRQQEFMKGQPGTQGYLDPGMGDWQYEIEMEQNIRYIADMQSQMSHQLTLMNEQLGTIMETGTGTPGASPGTNALLPDVNAIKNTGANILHQVSELRSSLERGGPQGSQVASEQMQPVYEVKALVQQNTQLLAGMEKFIKEAGHRCATHQPPPSSCVSPLFFLVAVVIQMMVVVGYMMYQQRKEVAAKKFF